MKENRTKSALLVIDMENGFVDADSPHCIAYAKASVPACADAVSTARKKGIHHCGRCACDQCGLFHSFHGIADPAPNPCDLVSGQTVPGLDPVI